MNSPPKLSLSSLDIAIKKYEDVIETLKQEMETLKKGIQYLRGEIESIYDGSENPFAVTEG